MNPLGVSLGPVSCVSGEQCLLITCLYLALGLLGRVGMPNHHHCWLLHLLPKRTIGMSLSLGKPPYNADISMFMNRRASHKMILSHQCTMTHATKRDNLSRITGFTHKARRLHQMIYNTTGLLRIDEYS